MVSPVSPSIGSRLKEKRLLEGCSIRELARRSGLTASFISQVENGKTNLSLASLRKVSDALGVQMLFFLTEAHIPAQGGEAAQPGTPLLISAEPGGLIDRSSPLIKRDMRARLFLPESGITYELLTSRLDHKMEAFMGRMAPGTGNVAGRLRITTEEFIFCLSGVLKVGVRDQVYLLEEGDSIYFDGPSLTMLASGTETAETVWLSVITPPAF